MWTLITATLFCWMVIHVQADILKEDGLFRYPSYVQDIMGPYVFRLCFRSLPLGVVNDPKTSKPQTA